MEEEIRDNIIKFQRNEITEHFIYQKLSMLEKTSANKEVFRRIAGDELKHYGIWRRLTGVDVKPDNLKVFWYLLIARIFGVTFAVKLMESGEENAQTAYEKIATVVPEAREIIKDENQHENDLISMIDEEKLKYMGSVVLGLNDALVELTGTLAGLTFALQNAKLVGVAGLITGIAASFSMAASEYLSTKAEGGEKHPLRASIYTGVAYVLAVTVLILPYLILSNPFISLGTALLGAFLLIFLFTYYYAVVREVSFRKRFLEMVTISMGVASLSFVIGLIVRQFLGIEI